MPAIHNVAAGTISLMSWGNRLGQIYVLCLCHTGTLLVHVPMFLCVSHYLCFPLHKSLLSSLYQGGGNAELLFSLCPCFLSRLCCQRSVLKNKFWFIHFGTLGTKVFADLQKCSSVQE